MEEGGNNGEDVNASSLRGHIPTSHPLKGSDGLDLTEQEQEEEDFRLPDLILHNPDMDRRLHTLSIQQR